jgi:hypothetical protein
MEKQDSLNELYIENYNKEMMAKFQKLNEEYNKMASQGNYIDKNLIDNIEEKIILNEENITDIICKANNYMKKINKQTTEFNEIISEYEGYKKDCRTLLDGISKLSDMYYDLSKKTQNIELKEKLDVKEHFIDVNFITNISNFEKDIDISINDKLEKIINNNKKLYTFKMFVKECLTNEDKQIKKNICSVCFSNKINTCLNPCGHTFCLKCVDKMKKKCAICRSNFNSAIKMFILDDDNDDENKTNSEGVDNFSGFNNNLQGMNLYSNILDNSYI